MTRTLLLIFTGIAFPAFPSLPAKAEAYEEKPAAVHHHGRHHRHHPYHHRQDDWNRDGREHHEQ
jgi:ferredoxin-NADP reductase